MLLPNYLPLPMLLLTLPMMLHQTLRRTLPMMQQQMLLVLLLVWQFVLLFV
jgi:hypothetical protein